MSIKQKIALWDGKSASDIEAVYNLHHDEADFADTIVRLVKDTSSQKGATWLLKSWLESGNNLEEKNIDRVYSSLAKLEDWESKLHILQSI